MKVEKVYYQTNFPLEKFIFENIGISIILEDGDDPKEVLTTAKKWCEREHKRLNPHLFPVKPTTQAPPPPPQPLMEEGMPVIQIQEPRDESQPDLVAIQKYQNALNSGDKDMKKEMEEKYPTITKLGLKPASKLKTKAKSNAGHK